MNDWTVVFLVAVVVLFVWTVAQQLQIYLLKIEVEFIKKYGIQRHTDQMYEAKNAAFEYSARVQESVEIAHDRTAALANALGYKWTRTEAREGWERRSPFADCISTPMKPSRWVFCDELPRYSSFGFTPEFKAKMAAPCPPPKPTAKKPTRTAAKRGPQRRATH